MENAEQIMVLSVDVATDCQGGIELQKDRLLFENSCCFIDQVRDFVCLNRNRGGPRSPDFEQLLEQTLDIYHHSESGSEKTAGDSDFVVRQTQFLS